MLQKKGGSQKGGDRSHLRRSGRYRPARLWEDDGRLAYFPAPWLEIKNLKMGEGGKVAQEKDGQDLKGRGVPSTAWGKKLTKEANSDRRNVGGQYQSRGTNGRLALTIVKTSELLRKSGEPRKRTRRSLLQGVGGG